MSKLEELIAKLCPNGVEYKPLWSLTAWDKRFNGIDKSMQIKIIPYKYYLSSEFDNVEDSKGNVLYLSTGLSKEKRYTTESLAGDHLCEGEVVCIPWGGTPNVKYYKGKFVTGDNRIATSLDKSVLNNKFLYYWMQNNIDTIATFYRGAGIQHPSMKSILSLNIPLPPMEVQEEIVRILDKFTELTAELTARKKQYEFYKDRLLSIHSTNLQKLKDIANFRNGIGHEKNIVSTGKYIVVNSKFISTNGQVIKFSNEQLCPLYVNDILMVMSDLPNGKALAKCYLVEENNKYTLNQRIAAIHIKTDKVLTKYLFYILSRNKQLLLFDDGSNQTNLRKNDILEILVPVPPLEEQKRIVEILDRFDKLCNDLTEGLPAEIEARKRQYEYYRDKLLNFD